MSKNIETKQSCPQGSFPYTIRSGDTLYILAQRYHTSVEEIMRVNPGINPGNLQIGQVICIPTGSQPIPPTPPCKGFYHTIKSGDTIWRLSQQYGVSVEAILRANPGINPNNLQIGQRICIPTGATPTPPGPSCPNGFLYTIKAGDTYYKLSRQFGVSMDAIIKANPGVNPDNLQIGQVICIPTH